MRLNVRLEATTRPRQTVLLGGPHNNQLLATPERTTSSRGGNFRGVKPMNSVWSRTQAATVAPIWQL